MNSFYQKAVQYELQTATNSLKINLQEILDISNQESTQKFQQFALSRSSSNIVDAFIPLSALNNQTIEDVKENGLIIDPNDGLTFQLTDLPLNSKDKVIELIHITVSLGKVLNYQALYVKPSDYQKLNDLSFSSNLELDQQQLNLEPDFYEKHPTSANLTSGYDSLLLCHNQKYVVFKSEQVCAISLIRFPGSDLKIQRPHVLMCDICHKAPAEFWCENDQAAFCSGCNTKTHHLSKIFGSHKRIPISEAASHRISCSQCHDDKASHYCDECQLSLCQKCQEEHTHHHLIPLNVVIDRIQSISDPLSNLSQKIQDEIDKCDKELQKIDKNTHRLIDEINRISKASSLAVLYNELRVPKQILWCQGWTHGWSPPGMAKFKVDDGYAAATAKPDGK